MKRIVLFVLTNLAVLLTLSVTARLLGADRFLGAQGMQFGSLLVFAALFGFGGALISLAMSRWVAKMSVGAQVITQPQNELEAWLLGTVRRLAQQAGIGMPEVAIYDAPEVNAFATGMRRDASLVAVSSGLLHTMSRSEAEAVLAHEVSHIANGDMVTMTLLQGVINTFVIFVARAVGWAVERMLQGEGRQASWAYFLTYFVLEIVLGLLGSLIVMWFSRQREFRADAGAARLVGREAMIAALRRLQGGQAASLPARMAALGIHGLPGGRLGRLFSSHPPLAARIAALQSWRAV
ncbi:MULTISPECIES: protease HtpX [unclassified Paludibacterium]|uniref:protease HtpX n=1 Tax=unclassified Paludibacterium TaxID=2618429 RepID=UPI001C058734|nr:protease HtpX [Paludibacterium sp. B53371]BEV72658.1 protease HtpX [Paludibacterium sp. THUN1379]